MPLRRPLLAALLLAAAGCTQSSNTCQQTSECREGYECRDEWCCMPWASRCQIPQQCCSGTCAEGRCVPLCRVGGLSCHGNADCCSQQCTDAGLCTSDPDAGFCAALLEDCTSTQCCGDDARNRTICNEDDRCCQESGAFCQADWICCSWSCNMNVEPWACD